MSGQTEQTDFSVTHDAANHRFDAARPDGTALGYLMYDPVAAQTANGKGSMVITHTVVEPAYQGHGIASVLTKEALDFARAERYVVIPECWFARGYIERHAEYQNLLP
jgi:predicted GNAT family acetyltransferase